MASLLLGLADKILDPIIDILVRKLLRHPGYVVYYKKNINELRKKKENLEQKMGEIKEKVEEANIQNDIVEKKVEEWAQKAEDKKREVENLMVNKDRDENVKCHKFFCPNLCSRYRMSKEAVRKKGNIEGHIQRCNFEVVARRRPPPLELQLTSTGNFMDFPSRKQLLKLIKDGLKSENPKDNMIGVYGPGGIGKTTAVEEVAKQLKREGVFHEIVKGVVSQVVNVREIQGQLADQLDLKLCSETEVGRRGALWNRLNNGKNNLVILDDLWSEVNLNDIGIPVRHNNKGCRVILTTRGCDVLTKMEVGKFIPVKVLSKDEALALFEMKVGVNFASAGLNDVAKLVCEECQGLPVAILAVGAALTRKMDIRIWNDALFQLQTSSLENIEGIDPKMYTSLRLSYDRLDKEAKSIMLLCCLYPEDYNISTDFLLFHCIASGMLGPGKKTVDMRNRIITKVSSLKDRSLLLDGKDENHVKMHDVIRDVVLSIAKTDAQYLVKNVTNDWPDKGIIENMAAISVRLNKLKEVPNELVCPRLHTLRIECEDYSFQFPDNFFSGLRELTVLELKRIRMSSTPSSLSNLSKLQTLILIECKLEDMSFLKGLKSNLEVLVIMGYIRALPTELGELSHLRVLLLRGSYGLKLIPAGVISKLTSLEELCLPDRESKEIEISRATLLSSLTQLTNLSLFIPDVALVPDVSFGKLASYRIAVGECFKEYYFKERNLKLEGITYDDKLFTLLERAEVLYLYRVKGLKDVLNKKGKGFSELERIVIRDCDDLDCLLGTPNMHTSNQGPDQSNLFSKLTVLNVSGCSFKFLFTSSCAKGLQQLQELDIRDCDNLEEIVGTEGEKDEPDHFSKLEILVLNGLPKLITFGPQKKENTTVEGDSLPKGQSLFNEKVAFPSLEKLHIRDCPRITEIWDKHVRPKESFPLLVRLSVRECEKLVEIIVSNTGVESANNKTIIFPCLKELRLWKLKNLKSFWGSSSTSESHHLFGPQVAFPSLEKLHIRDCPSITEIWDKHVLPKESFPLLVLLSVWECEKLAEIIVSNTGVESANNKTDIFPCLKELSLGELKNLKSFWGSSSTSESHHLFGPQVAFPSLENLHITYCPRITGIWDKHVLPKESFPQLVHLSVRECWKLVEIIVSNTGVECK